ncbi:hypothetical protein DE146DRAFT_718899 [Phaeosphaeria sp. MPI-PUGE-AT-0046c]|nr:hypothetical protein DE146DRAFT_718899 [Phaeosphaeria sp. MPI-PUGE-AT-0046c]
MYVIRQALRTSTGRRPARFIHGRRYPSIPRLRSLHTTPSLLNSAKPPPGSNSTPIGKDDASQAASDQPLADETADTAIASEDPELLGQRLQRSRETSRRYAAALRRQQRSKKSQDLPPIHIPDWFLKRRVKHGENLLQETERRPQPAYLSLSVTNSATGERASCSVPVSEDSDNAKLISRLLTGLWGLRLDDDEARRTEDYLQERWAKSERTMSKNATTDPSPSEKEPSTTGPSPTDQPASSTPPSSDFPILEQKWKTRLSDFWLTADHGSQAEQPDVLKRRLRELKKQIDRPESIDIDPAWSSQQKQDAILKKKEARLEKWFKKATTPKKMPPINSTSPSISPIVLAEIRATVAASLFALQPSLGDSFPAAKTNLILHSSTAAQEGAVDVCLRRIVDDLQSDLIVLTAPDLAQLGGDYLGEGPEPTPRSIRSLGYETYRLHAELSGAVDDLAQMTEGAPETEGPSKMADMINRLGIPLFGVTMPKRDFDRNYGGLFGSSADSPRNANTIPLGDNPMRTPSQNEVQLEDMKLAALLEALIDANEVKRDRALSDAAKSSTSLNNTEGSRSHHAPRFFDYSVGSEGTTLELNSALPTTAANTDISLSVSLGSLQTEIRERTKIIYIKDFKEMNATHYGGRIIQKLEELVRKRRVAGESIMIIGSTCSRELTPELSASGVRGLQGEGETSFFRTIVVDGVTSIGESNSDDVLVPVNIEIEPTDITSPEITKMRNINLSHIREMLRALDPVVSANITNMEKGSEHFQHWASIFPRSYFTRVLSYDEVHRVALTALGLCLSNPAGKNEGVTEQLSWAHVALSIGLLKGSDLVKCVSFNQAKELAKMSQEPNEHVEGRSSAKLRSKKKQELWNSPRQRHLRQISQTANQHEQLLMPGIADPEQIKTTFDQVHVPPETVDAIRTITSLSLLRPDAFDYGILATEKITGALLYGPPGTGKTLLAKATAKESGSTVLEVSGAQILGKYVGESEKSVAAIFSLAQKLSPCIVFLDEADAILGSRDAFHDRGSHRQTLNQFLKEWDGLNDSSVFVMVATNRPFDLDDAVLRRLPRRLLVDLPTETDRKEILRIHLNGEQLDETVNLDDLAKRTPFYSGSDLKNIAVSAALACVKEENEQASLAAAKATPEAEPQNKAHIKNEAVPSTPKTTDQESSTAPETSSAAPPPPQVLHLTRGQTYNFPEKRTLHKRHFDQALQEISASISENMTSLNAIKKFDEQYGDRRGKKKRKDFGFGVAPPQNESAARVRM